MHNTFTPGKAGPFHSLARTFVLIIGCLFSNPAAYAENTAAREPILVTGHSNPDTDSTASAIAASYLLNQLGKPAIPITQGPLNPETKYVLERFSVSSPEPVGNVAHRNVAIVDFTDTTQAPAGFDKANLVFIADHHKLGNVTSISRWRHGYYPTEVPPLFCIRCTPITAFRFRKTLRVSCWEPFFRTQSYSDRRQPPPKILNRQRLWPKSPACTIFRRSA